MRIQKLCETPSCTLTGLNGLRSDQDPSGPGPVQTCSTCVDSSLSRLVDLEATGELRPDPGSGLRSSRALWENGSRWRPVRGVLKFLKCEERRRQRFLEESVKWSSGLHLGPPAVGEGPPPQPLDPQTEAHPELSPGSGSYSPYRRLRKETRSEDLHGRIKDGSFRNYPPHFSSSAAACGKM
ncbi:protocadherin Fat 2 [Lates japonicus]|uniref:Protocadherin Fat 2 n=1 Tax=Lates japonicus TaxID=270547 RepID=A0AAD3N9P9_LATJO|nr:protocadherin Fat 2 [Lates japonicus]